MRYKVQNDILVNSFLSFDFEFSSQCDDMFGTGSCFIKFCMYLAQE